MPTRTPQPMPSGAGVPRYSFGGPRVLHRGGADGFRRLEARGRRARDQDAWNELGGERGGHLQIANLVELALEGDRRGRLERLADDQGVLDDREALPYIAQDRGKRRYFGREVPQGGRIDWNAPARRIHDFVRACDYHPFASPWGTPRARLGDQEVEVSRTALTGERCDVAPGTARDDLVATADEWLRLKKVETI